MNKTIYLRRTIDGWDCKMPDGMFADTWIPTCYTVNALPAVVFREIAQLNRGYAIRYEKSVKLSN